MHFPGGFRIWMLALIWSAKTSASRGNWSLLPDLLCFKSTHLYESSVCCTTRLPYCATDADVDVDAMTDVDDEATMNGDESDVDGDDADGKELA